MGKRADGGSAQPVAVDQRARARRAERSRAQRRKPWVKWTSHPILESSPGGTEYTSPGCGPARKRIPEGPHMPQSLAKMAQ
jgi:hypothetical protein